MSVHDHMYWDMILDDDRCEVCNVNDAKPSHNCPYAEDVEGDYDSQCTCCDDCAHECAMGI